MTTLTDKFEAFEAQVAADAAATAAALADIQTALDFINAQLDTQTLNNAANTRYLLSALSQNSPCVDCEGASLVVPPTDDTATGQTEELCKRVQAFLHAMNGVYTALDVMSSFGIGFSTTLLTNALNEVITALSNSDATPLPSFPEAAQIVGDGVSYVASNLLVGHTLIGLFTPLYFDLLKPMFVAGNAAAAQSVYNGVIEGTDYGIFERRLLEHAAYNSLYSYYFDPTSTPNLAGYDGSICFTAIPDITECTDFTSTDYVIPGVGTFQAVQSPPMSGTYPWAMTGDIYGFSIEMVVGESGGDHSAVYSIYGGVEHLLFNIGIGSGAQTVAEHTTVFSIRTHTSEFSANHWTCRVCPPS